jgi:hypothetical protein
LQQCLFVLVSTDQRRQAGTPRKQCKHRVGVVRQVTPRQERLAGFRGSARMNVDAGSDPDVVENDGGAGLGRRHGFFGF